MNTRVKAFSESAQGVLLRAELLKMAKSDEYNTVSTYSVTDTNGLSFVEKHMKYMSQYPTMNHLQYVSNLKVMTKQTSTVRVQPAPLR
jgi:hypothetical protein